MAIKLDGIGGYKPYRLAVPAVESPFSELRKFLCATDDWLAAYEVCQGVEGKTMYADGNIADVLRLPLADEADISTDIWHLAVGGTLIFRVLPEPNNIALALIVAELFQAAEWRLAVGQVYFIGRGYKGMPDALYYVLKKSERMLLPPAALRKAPMHLFAPKYTKSQKILCEEWLQRHPDAPHHCFSPRPV